MVGCDMVFKGRASRAKREDMFLNRVRAGRKKKAGGGCQMDSSRPSTSNTSTLQSPC